MRTASPWRRDDPHYVYRCYDAAGRLLYVGSTYNPPQRMRQHSYSTPWFTDVARVRLIVFPTKAYAGRKEAEAIASQQPLHNVWRGNVDGSPGAAAIRLLRGGAA